MLKWLAMVAYTYSSVYSFRSFSFVSSRPTEISATLIIQGNLKEDYFSFFHLFLTITQHVLWKQAQSTIEYISLHFTRARACMWKWVGDVMLDPGTDVENLATQAVKEFIFNSKSTCQFCRCVPVAFKEMSNIIATQTLLAFNSFGISKYLWKTQNSLARIKRQYKYNICI